MFPMLPLSQVQPDLELARRLPQRLAYYHLALPIAQDEMHITVAMAFPDKGMVMMLETVLGMSVMPVRSDPKEIRALLDVIWQDKAETRIAKVLAWSDLAQQQQKVREYALHIAPAWGLQCDETAIDTIALDDLLRAAEKINPALIVAAVSDIEQLQELLRRSSAPVLVLRGEVQTPDRILHILRGHTSDRHVLDRVIPLAHHFSASVTLLTAAASAVADYRHGNLLSSDFAHLLLQNHPVLLTEYGQVLASANIKGNLKIRQGLLESVIADEFKYHPYDLIAIAAKAYGDFVYRVMQNLSGISTAFLIVKP